MPSISPGEISKSISFFNLFTTTSSPEWLRSGHNCTLIPFSMLENFASYNKNKSVDYNVILEELTTIQHYKSKERPEYSSVMIKFALLLQYSSGKTYRLLLEQLPLPSFSLFNKLTSGNIDAIKLAKLLLKINFISDNCVLIIDGIFAKVSGISHWEFCLSG